MEKDVAVIICNYNKKEYVLQCIKSVMDLTFQNFDLYVVDNASTDGSADAIEEVYGEKVILIRNKENLGGSGGFNTGMRLALGKGYKYLYLLDNDVVLDEQALAELYGYMEKHDHVGVVGSLLYSMDSPVEIQEMGAEIDWDNFYIKPKFKGNLENKAIPLEFECDYVPACSMLVRTEAVIKAGLMDEGNFIYWDDIEWGYRIKQHGYRVVAYAKSKVWHKMGVAAKTNTFGTYFFWRNRVNFFVRALDKEEIYRFAEKLFAEIFQAMYACNYTGKFNSARTIIFAVEDAINNIRGKAPEGRVLEREAETRRLEDIIGRCHKILLISDLEVKPLRDVINKLHTINSNLQVTIATSEQKIKDLKTQFTSVDLVDKTEYKKEDYDLVGQVCNHVFEVRNEISDEIDLYIDRYFNLIASQDDINYVKNYDTIFGLLKNIYFPVFRQRLLNFKETIMEEGN